MAPLLENGTAPGPAREAAENMLAALNLPRAHWDLPPATFSGGEQQRVNLARSFVRNYPILLLDEPTASLDPENRAIVIGLVRAALANGAAMIGIFHDRDVRDQIATRNFEVADFRVAA
jgi:alpha-D-ribose 1-methylphosphonate 5-triphosphate synthase subunit PhnL